jgi:signal transduction histidine kinase
VSVAGSLVVRRGLTPVLALSRRIGSLQPGKVHLRLDGADQPRELQPVVEQSNALLERLEKAYAQLEAFNADVAHGMLPDGRLQLAVSNPGPTIDAQHLPRLFDRFYRAAAAREHSDTNHDLGLAILAAIARMHGGEPFAESASQQTRVGLRLPAVDP